MYMCINFMLHAWMTTSMCTSQWVQTITWCGDCLDHQYCLKNFHCHSNMSGGIQFFGPYFVKVIYISVHKRVCACAYMNTHVYHVFVTHAHNYIYNRTHLPTRTMCVSVCVSVVGMPVCLCVSVCVCMYILCEWCLGILCMLAYLGAVYICRRCDHNILMMKMEVYI